jgi:hypothetical protein
MVVMKHAGQAGNTLAEYATMIGAVALVAGAGLTLLGKSTNGLFQNADQHLQSDAVKNYVNLSFDSKPTTQKPESGPGYAGKNAVMTINPDTGIPAIQTTGVGINVTSVEGTSVNVYSTATAAQKLDSITITDPALQDWYSQVTKMTHFLAGAEGDQVGIKDLQIKSVETGKYNDGSAARDIYNYQSKLASLLANPPAGGDPTQITQVSTLAADAWNNAQSFLTPLTPYIKPDGTLDTPALANSKLGKNMSPSTYDSLVSYTALQQSVNTALTDPSVKHLQAVTSTLVDASTLQNTTQTATQPVTSTSP